MIFIANRGAEPLSLYIQVTQLFDPLLSPLWAIAAIVGALAIAYLIIRGSTFYRKEVEGFHAARFAQIDGLRGIWRSPFF